MHDKTTNDDALDARLEAALIAVLSQSRPPQNLRRLIAAAIGHAARNGLAAAVEFVEADVVRNRASND